MGIRKCIVPDCPSSTARPEDRGVTYHKIPFHEDMKQQWIVACRLPDDFRATKTTNVCSRHFRKADFQQFKGKKYVLKFGVVPTVFAWTIVSPAAGSSKAQPKTSPAKSADPGDDGEEFQHEVGDKDGDIVLTDEVQPTVKQEATESPAPKSTKASAKKPPKRARISKQIFKTPTKQARTEPPAASPRKQSPKKTASTPKSTPDDAVAEGGLEKGIDFTPGTKIEAQDFSGRWHPASLLEVDTEEREVLVQFDKGEKATTNEEWIPMDSVRLRPQQSSNFTIGEKVFARWSDSRKFKATIKSILENDMYEVLFDDGLAKICKSTHISRIKRAEDVGSRAAEEVEEPAKPDEYGVVVKTETPDQSDAKDTPVPLVSLSQFCIPQLAKVSELPEIPKDGEWCCHWMNDYPVGDPAELDLPGGRVYTVIVADWRLPEGWVKHIFQRVTAYGKMDTVLVSPTGKMLRSKQEIKKYLEDIGETYDGNTYDFGLHKKRAKDLGFCHYTQEYKDSFFPKPSAEPMLLNTEVNIGSVKVKIIDNLYQCPEEDCLKTFRKENHLQIHIKHYHKELAKGLGEIPNMQDLAALRNPVDIVEAYPKPSTRRSGVGAAAKMKDDKKELLHIKAEPDVDAEIESENMADAPEHVKSPIEIKQEEGKPAAPVKSVEAEAAGPKAESCAADEGAAAAASVPVAPAGSSSTTSKPKAQSKVTKIKLFSQKKQKGSLSKIRRGFVTKTGGSAKKVKRMKASQRAQANRSAPVLGANDSFDGQPFAGFGDFEPDRTVSFYDDSINASVPGGPGGLVDENGELIKIVRMRKEEIINCLCKVTEEDGLMVQCEMCLCWQHAYCQDIRSSSEVPETYVCSICRYPYRGRASKRYAHDQDWLFDGKLPVAKYHSGNSKHPQRFDILKNCHTLTGNLLELKRFMHSLQVKINIAENKDHPKMYLWSKKWEKSPPRGGGTTDPSAGAAERQPTAGEQTAGQPPMPQIPVPEAPIDPAECQAILLDHIQKQQNDAMGRLQAIEAQIIGLEAYDDKADLLESPTAKNYPKTKQTIHMLLNDLLKMKKIGAIHSDFNNLAQESKPPLQ